MKRKFWLWFYEMKYAILGIRRHLLLTISTLSALIVTLFLIGVFVIAGIHVEIFSSRIEQNLGIHVVLENSVNQKEAGEIEKEIKKAGNIQTVRFSSRDEELERMIQEKGEAFSMYRGKENPLSHAFFVYVNDGNSLQKTAHQIEKIEGVNKVAYGGKTTVRFVGILKKIRWIGYIGFILLAVLSLYLIYNTVRTSITARSDEIIIMRQVGAENSFIRRPFEWEGILTGIAGACIPVLILCFLYARLYESLHGRLFASVFALMPPGQIRFYLWMVLLICGVGIGMTASVLAASKYIKEKR